MSTIEQIIDIYNTRLPKHPIMLPHKEAMDYFTRLYMNGNIITYIKDNELIGFLEFWRINTEQFGRLCCSIPIGHEEDLLNGSISVITRMYIVPDERNSDVFITLGREFLSRNLNATHYVAIQSHKHHKPLQVYSREEILKHYKMEK